MDLLARTRNANDHRLPPTLVSAPQCLAHQLHVAHTLERVVDPPVGHLDDVVRDVTGFGRVHAVGRTELPGELELLWIGVHSDDPLRTGEHSALDRREPDAAETEDRDARTRLDFRRMQHGADSGRDPTAQKAHLVQRCILANLCQRNLGHHGVLGEGRGAHVVVEHLSAVGKPTGAVGHQTPPLSLADLPAEIGLARQTELALPTLGDVERDHVVPHREPAHTRPHFFDHTTTLVTEHCGEETFWVGATHRIRVGVTHARGLEPNQAFTFLRSSEIDLVDHQRLLRLETDGGLDLHRGGSLGVANGCRVGTIERLHASTTEFRSVHRPSSASRPVPAGAR